MFDNKGLIVIEKEPGMDEDEMMMTALDAGAEDVKVEEDAFEVYTAPNDFSGVREQLEKAGYAFISADVQMIPQNTVALPVDDGGVFQDHPVLFHFIDGLGDQGQVFSRHHRDALQGHAAIFVENFKNLCF